jgi:hypothetical protein
MCLGRSCSIEYAQVVNAPALYKISMGYARIAKPPFSSLSTQGGSYVPFHC